MGILFAYFIMIPIIWYFFLQFEFVLNNNFMNMHLEAKITDYLFLIFNLITYISIFCQIPFYLFILFYFNLIKINWLITNRKFIFFIILLIATYVTPADIFSQCVLCVCACLIFENTLFFLVLFVNYKKS